MFKPQLVAITVAIMGASMTGATLAQNQETEQLQAEKPSRAELRDKRPRQTRNTAYRLLQRMDTNADNLISLEEYIGDGITRYSQTFTRADKNEDGYVTLEELRPSRKAERPRVDSDALQACLEETGIATGADDERFTSADTNGDGALSQDEFFAMLEQSTLDRFSALDGDGDQQLTTEEIQASNKARNEARNEARRAMRSCMKEQRDLAQ